MHDSIIALDTIWTPKSGVTNDTLWIYPQTQTTEIDQYFAVKIDSVQQGTLGSTSQHMIYVQAENRKVPQATDSLAVQWMNSFLIDSTGSAEIVAHHPGTQRLFVLNSTKAAIEVLDFSNPRAIQKIKTIDMLAYGVGATSVAVWGDYIAATVDAGPEAQGSLILINPEGDVQSIVKVGNLPDMVTFTPDGQWVLTANEGQSKTDYSVDAEGSISMVNVSSGIVGILSSDVKTVSFADWNTKKDSLVALGLRIFGPGASLAQDVEPEYITVSANSEKAWVSLQENNAIAELNLFTQKIDNIIPLGTIDHSLVGQELDVSDKNSAVVIANWPIHGMYMPDALANLEFDGQTYILSANEGDAREYAALIEEAKVGDADYLLDSTVFPYAKLLKQSDALGRLAVTRFSGDLDGDGDFDQIHAFGGRSFSIWNNLGNRIYDSGSDFERFIAADSQWSSIFNASNDNVKFKNRSDNKGPEPEGITISKLRNRTYAFISLERVGGFMVYDVTNPSHAHLVSYSNYRSVSDASGDLGPEGIIVIPAIDSPTDTAFTSQ